LFVGKGLMAGSGGTENIKQKGRLALQETAFFV
jgi:hypothetical protein